MDPERSAQASLDRVFQALARPLDMSLAAVLQHVQVLGASGLVRSQKTGR